MISFFQPICTKSYNKIWIYRLGVTIKLSIILLVALLGPNISSLFWLVGILSGFMIATNGYIVNYFESEIIPKTEIIRYVGLGNAYSSLTNSIVPIILGGSIFLNSFEFTAIILCAIVGIELVVCFGIKGKKPKLHHHKLSYRNFIKLAIHDPKYRSLCLQQTLSGINRNGVMGLLVSVLVFQAVGNELSLGGWTSIFSISGIIAMLLFTRFYKNQRRTITQLTAGLLAILGCLPLFFEVNFINVVIFNFIFFTLIRLMEKIVHIDLINYSKTEPYQSRYLIEYFSIREIFLTIGRVIGYGSLGLVALFGLQLDGLRAIFILIAFSVILMAIVSARFSYLKSTK